MVDETPSINKYRQAKKEKGLCTWGGCPEPAATDRVLCEEHLLRNRIYVRDRHRMFQSRGLCRNCGKRPAITTVYCLVCRQGKDPLTRAMRKALKEVRVQELIQRNEAWLNVQRAKARTFLQEMELADSQSFCIEAYWGLDGIHSPLTLAQIGEGLGLTRERIRQLIKPFQTTARTLGLPDTGRYELWVRTEHGHGLEGVNAS